MTTPAPTPALPSDGASHLPSNSRIVVRWRSFASECLQHLKLDWYTTRWWLLGWAALALRYGEPEPAMSLGSSGLYFIGLALLVHLLLGNHPLLGDRAFWRTRPMSRSCLAAVKLFELAVCVAIWWAVTWVRLVILGFHPWPSLGAVLNDALPSLVLSTMLLWLATFSRNMIYFVALVVATWMVSAGTMSWLDYFLASWPDALIPDFGEAMESLPFFLPPMLVAAFYGTLFAIRYRDCHRGLARALGHWLMGTLPLFVAAAFGLMNHPSLGAAKESEGPLKALSGPVDITGARAPIEIPFHVTDQKGDVLMVSNVLRPHVTSAIASGELTLSNESGNPMHAWIREAIPASAKGGPLAPTKRSATLLATSIRNEEWSDRVVQVSLSGLIGYRKPGIAGSLPLKSKQTLRIDGKTQVSIEATKETDKTNVRILLWSLKEPNRIPWDNSSVASSGSMSLFCAVLAPDGQVHFPGGKGSFFIFPVTEGRQSFGMDFFELSSIEGAALIVVAADEVQAGDVSMDVTIPKLP